MVAPHGVAIEQAVPLSATCRTGAIDILAAERERAVAMHELRKARRIARAPRH